MQERDTPDSETTEIKFQSCNTVVMNSDTQFLCTEFLCTVSLHSEKNGSGSLVEKQNRPIQFSSA